MKKSSKKPLIITLLGMFLTGVLMLLMAPFASLEWLLLFIKPKLLAFIPKTYLIGWLLDSLFSIFLNLLFYIRKSLFYLAVNIP